MATQARRDYYAVLGVSRDADGAAIKKAFRVLAGELHPDVSDEPDTGERFREILEAYEVLSRPDARERYDRFGYVTRGVSGFEPRSSRGLFDDPAGPTPPRGQGDDVTIEAYVDFLDAARGTSRALRYAALAECETCHGHGTAGGAWRACTRCDGRGRHEEERTELVRVSPRTKDGARIRFAGKGSAGGPGGEPGDLYVTIRVSPPPDSPAFRRFAAAGAICGIALIVVTLVFFH